MAASHAKQTRLAEIRDEIGSWQDFLEFAASSKEDYIKAKAALAGLRAEKEVLDEEL